MFFYVCLTAVILITFLELQSFVNSYTSTINVNYKNYYKNLNFIPNSRHSHRRNTLFSKEESSSSEDNAAETGIDVSSDPRLYSGILPRAPGIEWGTDLSFSFVYVRAIEPGGAASQSGVVAVGDQICQLRAVVGTSELGEVQNLVGASFDSVMNSFATLEKTISEVQLVFFRGTKEDLIKAATSKGGDEAQEDKDNDEIVITVIENKGAKDEKKPRKIKARKGCNIRQVLVDNGINVYQSITRWTNCSGKQLCGTCIVNVASGGESTNRKSMDEDSTLRENPNTYRLSCVTFAYGDVVVETFPPISASQWTR